MIENGAIVDPKAQIGRNVTIRSGAIVGPDCVISDGCEIRHGAMITGHTTLGSGVQVGYHAVIGSEPQDLAYRGEPTTVQVGARTCIREHATINRGTGEGGETLVGEDCFLMTGAHVGHNARVGNRVIMANNSLLGGYAEIGEGAVLGGGSVFHQFVRIGKLVMAQGNAGASMDIPPYCITAKISEVVGLNRIGLKRAGIAPPARKAIASTYKIFYRSGLNRLQAVEKLDNEVRGQFPEVDEFIDFIKAHSKRGIAPARYRKIDESDG